MTCSSCGHDNPAGARFCNACGTEMERRCAACGVQNPPGARFCNSCGASLPDAGSGAEGAEQGASPQARKPSGLAALQGSGRGVQGSAPRTPYPEPRSYTPPHLAERILAEQAALSARGATEGERKTITALFADITGSMELIEDLDPEEARSIVDPALQVMMDAVHRYEGYVAQSTGDGIFALFGAPIAHEDHPQRALFAALLMQEGIRKHAEGLRRQRGVNLAIRVGLNTGEVVVRAIRKDDLHTDYTPVGHSTGLAARMERLATPGSIVISEHTYKLTEGYFHFKPLGLAQVKGVAEPVAIYEVLGVGPLRTRLQVSARRGLSRFVGRQDELTQMRRALERAEAGHGQIIAVVGEAGVGKSRLTYEFKLLAQRSCLVLETFSVAHAKTFAYLPLIELLKSYVGITLQDDERQRREKVTGKVLTLDRSLEDLLPYVCAVLGIPEPSSALPPMDPQIRRQRTLDAVKRLLLRESLNQPLLVIVEDLHWLDSETEAFLNVLSESVATARLLLLVNYRPEYQHGWGNKSYYTQLRLDPLTREAAEEMLSALLNGGAQHAAPLRQLILDKTEGNPFFMEEMVHALFDQGVLTRGVGGDGLVRLTRPLSDIRLPTTVQGILAARIDRLPPGEKALLQTLSVLGKDFSAGLVQKLAGVSEGEQRRMLAHLQAAEFIFEEPAFPEPAYTFKHALTQDVAYNSLLIERRQVLHERAALAIEEVFPDRLEEHYGELAHHYSRSGAPDKAIPYLQMAAGQALQRSAFTEAIGHLTGAEKLLQTLPDSTERKEQELLVQVSLGRALKETRGWADPGAERAYGRARELSQQVQGIPHLLMALGGLFGFYMSRGEFRTARELGEQFSSLVSTVNDPTLQTIGYYVMGQVSSRFGEFLSAREHFEKCIEAYEEEPQHSALIDLEFDPHGHRFFTSLGMEDPHVGALMFVAPVLWHLGFPDQALQKVHEAVSLARELSHHFSLFGAIYCSAMLSQLRGEAEAAREQAETVITMAGAQGLTLGIAQGMIVRGWALAAKGELDTGIAQLQQGLEAIRAGGAHLSAGLLARLAGAYGKAGRVEDGLRILAEASQAVERSEERAVEAELYRLKGELLEEAERRELRVASPRTPEQCFREAIEIARRQSAKSWELRAVTSLSRLWQRQGKKDDARQLLAETYNWFTEGFDTRDLIDAKALLEELG